MVLAFSLGRFFSFLALILLFIVFPAQAAQDRYAALIVDAKAGTALFERNAHEVRYPASLTKMMTLYMIFDALDRNKLSLKQRVRFSRKAASRPPAKLYVKAGESITVEQAILALVTRSANDVATAVAEALGKTETQFARMMTKQARALGMKKTHFRNASGLHHRNQVTTAWDMYRLARALQTRFPHYYHYFSTPRFAFRKARHRNHNRLLKNYPGTDGIKTGYIRASGFNLAASVHRDGHHIIGIVFGGRTSKSRDAHMRALLDKGFEQLKSAKPAVRLAGIQLQPLTLIAKSQGVGLPVQGQGQGSAGIDLMPDASGLGWTVQVGAFSQIATAKKQTSDARSAVPHVLASAKIAIDPLVRDGKTLYRARFVGLSQFAARTACQTLQEKNIDCISVPPTG